MGSTIVPVILAGGQGTRLWPMSRTERPKQFLPLFGGASLFQKTLLRIGNAARYCPPIVVTQAEYRSLVEEEAAQLGQPLQVMLLEPMARNTAAAIAAAADYAARLFGADIVLNVLPSDHDVEIGDAYWQANDLAREAACRGHLVTFGIRPTSPETGYGYIKSAACAGKGASPVEHFVEKPALERAVAMLSAGGHLWNSGMFMFQAGAFLEECAALAPDTLSIVRSALRKAKALGAAIFLHEPDFAQAPDISVDCAILEKTRKAVVVAADHGWTDLGNWDALWKRNVADAEANFTQGQVTLDDVTGSLVVTDHAHVAVQGLKDIAVVATRDAIFVTRRSAAQKVSGIVKRLRTNAQTKALTQVQQTTYKPWGNYASVVRGERYQVKRIFVKPGQKLSLQRHHHRSEHWIVVRGAARVTIDAHEKIVHENESVYIPIGALHRLENPGQTPLELIEVQTGSYLGEDDIIRIEDDYRR